MKALKVVGIVLGSIVVLILILALIAFFLLRASCGTYKQVKQVPTSPAAAQSFQTKLDNLVAASKTAPKGTPETLTLTQEEINSKIWADLPSKDIPDYMKIKDLDINLKDGGSIAAAKVTVDGVQVNVGANVDFAVENGHVLAIITKVDVGAMPLPGGIKEKIINALPDDGKIDMGSIGALGIQGVKVVNGQLVVSGVTK